MKAVEIKKNGGPEVLELKDITLDKPGPDQVTIEQKAIGLNYIDTYHRSGLYPLKMPSLYLFQENQLMRKLLEVDHL